MHPSLTSHVVRLPPRPVAGVTRAAWEPAGPDGVATLFVVRPLGGGWRLQGEDLEAVVFARGWHAERQARRLARCVATLGRDAKVNVHDARDRLVGAISFYGWPSPPGPESSARYPWA